MQQQARTFSGSFLHKMFATSSQSISVHIQSSTMEYCSPFSSSCPSRVSPLRHPYTIKCSLPLSWESMAGQTPRAERAILVKPRIEIAILPARQLRCFFTHSSLLPKCPCPLQVQGHTSDNKATGRHYRSRQPFVNLRLA